jgi:hypothetical protein
MWTDGETGRSDSWHTWFAIDFLEPPPKAAFLCGFDWFRIDHFAIASHGFVDQFTKNSGAWLPVSTLRLKPDECFWADVNNYSWHGCAKIGFNNIQ